MASTANAAATGNQDIDGLIHGRKWTGTLTYSFPDLPTDYLVSGSAGLGGVSADLSLYGEGEPLSPTFAQVSAAQQQAVHNILGQVAACTNLAIEFAGTNSADLRIAQSSGADPTAHTYYPGSDEGGDVWFGTQYNYRAPALGDYSYLTHIHELGHALGLKHGHATGGVANTALPSAHDSLEYSAMTYRSYAGAPTSSYSNETYGYPTTFMMNDIRALQELYGADFTTQGGNTVYGWNPLTGEFSIDGTGQGRPGGANAPASANVVFMTVWDGGGIDTYDFSAYTTGLTVDLNPGSYSVTSSTQLAFLGNGQSAHGNVYNAYLYNGDVRSYIENAVGGSGGDSLSGNAANNRLDGRAGTDTLSGGVGDDVFVYGVGYGSDMVADFAAGAGGVDEIDLSAFAGIHSLADVLQRAVQVGASTVITFASGQTLTLQNVSRASLTASDFIFNAGPDAAPTAIALANASIQENLAGGTIGAVSVTDPNGDTAFTFITSDARFQVVGTPGAYQLALASGVALDYESEASIPVTVTATDARGLAFSKSFTISVIDVPGATITGTSSSETIDATRAPAGQSKPTSENDTISAMAGNDTVRGGGGNDAIDGGSGNDALFGEAGNDRLTGGTGTDKLDGGEGNDTLVLSASIDYLDTLSGGSGTDTVLVTGTGVLTLAGFNAGTASIESWSGNGAGITATADANNVYDLSALNAMTGLAYIDAGAGTDTITGSRFADDLRGGAGNDTLNGGLGNDRLTGGSGTDTLNGGDGSDTLVVSGTNNSTDSLSGDNLAGAGGTDTLEVTGTANLTLAKFNAAQSSIEVWDGNDAAVLGTTAVNTFDFSGLTSVSGMRYVDASSGNDILVGSRFADDLRGGSGNDRLTGGQGADRLSGSTGNDTFALADGFGHDVITDFTEGSAVADVIEFDDQLFANFAAVQGASRQVGADVVITVDESNSITLTSTDLADLHVNDFAFV